MAKFCKKIYFHIFALLSIVCMCSLIENTAIAEKSKLLKLVYNAKTQSTSILSFDPSIVDSLCVSSLEELIPKDGDELVGFHGTSILQVDNELLVFGRNINTNAIVMYRMDKKNHNWVMSQVTEKSDSNVFVTKALYDRYFGQIFLIGEINLEPFIYSTKLPSSLQDKVIWQQVDLAKFFPYMSFTEKHTTPFIPNDPLNTSNTEAIPKNVLRDIANDNNGNIVVVGRNIYNIGVILETPDGWNWRKSFIDGAVQNIDTVSYLSQKNQWLALANQIDSCSIFPLTKKDNVWGYSNAVNIPEQESKEWIPISSYVFPESSVNNSSVFLSFAQANADLYVNDVINPYSKGVKKVSFQQQLIGEGPKHLFYWEPVRFKLQSPIYDLIGINDFNVVGFQHIKNELDQSFLFRILIFVPTPPDKKSMFGFVDYAIDVEDPSMFYVNQKQNTAVFVEDFSQFKRFFKVKKKYNKLDSKYIESES